MSKQVTHTLLDFQPKPNTRFPQLALFYVVLSSRALLPTPGPTCVLSPAGLAGALKHLPICIINHHTQESSKSQEAAITPFHSIIKF